MAGRVSLSIRSNFSITECLGFEQLLHKLSVRQSNYADQKKTAESPTWTCITMFQVIFRWHMMQPRPGVILDFEDFQKSLLNRIDHMKPSFVLSIDFILWSSTCNSDERIHATRLFETSTPAPDSKEASGKRPKFEKVSDRSELKPESVSRAVQLCNKVKGSCSIRGVLR